MLSRMLEPGPGPEASAAPGGALTIHLVFSPLFATQVLRAPCCVLSSRLYIGLLISLYRRVRRRVFFGRAWGRVCAPGHLLTLLGG